MGSPSQCGHLGSPDLLTARQPFATNDVLAHIWPGHHANVNFQGTHTVDIDGELATLDTDGYRPLRPPPGPARAEHRQ